MIPDVHRHRRHAVILVQDHRQAVRQREHRERHGRASRRAGAALLGASARHDARARAIARTATAAKFPSDGHAGCSSSPQSKLNCSTHVLVPAAVRAHAQCARADGGGAPRVGHRVLLDLTDTNPTAVGHFVPARRAFVPRRSARPRISRPIRWGYAAARAAVAADVSSDRAPAVAADRHRPDGEHERGVCAAVQAAVRSGRRRARAAAELSAVRSADAASKACRRGRIGSSITACGRSIATASSARSRPTTRAMLVVSPNNPTGSLLRADDREWLVDARARSRARAHLRRGLRRLSARGARPDATSLVG